MDGYVPSLWAAKDAPDDERMAALAEQAALPSDLVNPADAMGDAEWEQAVNGDFAGGGLNALAEFQARWDWDMTPAQRASALADVAFRRESAAFVDDASSLMARPPVDPEEYAAEVHARRAERARRG